MPTPTRPSPVQVVLNPNLSRIGRTLAGGHAPSIAKAVFAHPHLWELVIAKVLDLVTTECNTLCCRSSENPSIFRSVPIESLERFSWEDCAQELKVKAPVLFQLLVTAVSHNDHRNTHKQGCHHLPLPWNMHGCCSSSSGEEQEDVWCSNNAFFGPVQFTCSEEGT